MAYICRWLLSVDRFKLDIDAEPVAETELNRILQPAHLKAAVLVSELRDKCTSRA